MSGTFVTGSVRTIAARRSAEGPSEAATEVALVGKPCFGRRRRDGFTGPEHLPGVVEPSHEAEGVGRNAVVLGERARVAFPAHAKASSKPPYRLAATELDRRHSIRLL